MNFTFDLQLFNGGGPNSQQQNADNYYQQLAGDSNAMVGDFNSLDMPALQKLIPQLQSILTGNIPPALMNAAMAPVNASTNASLNTLRSNPNGLANPNALYADLILGGNEKAGLAADGVVNNTYSSALSALTSLLGLGYQGANAGMNGLDSAAGGEANLGGQIWNQNNAWWQDALGAAGAAYGYKTGNYNNQPTANSSFGGSSPMITPNPATTSTEMQTTASSSGFNPYTFALPNGVTATTSAPISSNGPQP